MLRRSSTDVGGSTARDCGPDGGRGSRVDHSGHWAARRLRREGVLDGPPSAAVAAGGRLDVLFGYPLAATHNNWLHDCVCETVRNIHATVDAGRRYPVWPQILPDAYRA